MDVVIGDTAICLWLLIVWLHQQTVHQTGLVQGDTQVPACLGQYQTDMVRGDKIPYLVCSSILVSSSETVYQTGVIKWNNISDWCYQVKQCIRLVLSSKTVYQTGVIKWNSESDWCHQVKQCIRLVLSSETVYQTGVIKWNSISD